MRLVLATAFAAMSVACSKGEFHMKRDRAAASWRCYIPLLLLTSTALADPGTASHVLRKPKVRAITAFVRIDATHYRAQFQKTLDMLRAAKSTFEKGGYEVQTVRITTQPFQEYVGGISEAQALQLFTAMDDLAAKESFYLNIGPLLIDRREGPSQVGLLSKVLATTKINASLPVASTDGVDWTAVRAAAEVVKYVEEHSSNGAGNFDFAAVAMVPPGGPFYPGSNHHGSGHEFSIGWEAGAFVADVLAETRGDATVAEPLLSRKFDEQARAVDALASKVAGETGWSYLGLDPTTAPGSDSSIGAAIETFLGAKFGSSGTLTAAAMITAAERSISVKRVGYSGLMLPVLEDPVLSERWAEGLFDLDSLLAYSAVCGTGLDVIPLPGDVSRHQLERIIGDMASLAFRWNKPLTARLVPAPGKKAGDRTDFDFGLPFPNTTLRPLK
jgi:uncharacterized protein (UPF0210 family)